MAQWAGQFTGLTHATNVEDAEHSLRSAVGNFPWWPEEERPRREKAIRKIAARVLRLRLKLLEARARTVTIAGHADRLRAEHAVVEAGGVAAILTEFGLVERPRAGP